MTRAFFDYAVTYGKAKPGSLAHFLSGEKGLKYLSGNFLWNTCSRVFNFHIYLLILTIASNDNFFLQLLFQTRGRSNPVLSKGALCHISALASMASPGIDEKVYKYLLKPSRICHDRGKGRGYIPDYHDSPDLELLAEDLVGPFQDFYNIHPGENHV